MTLKSALVLFVAGSGLWLFILSLLSSPEFSGADNHKYAQTSSSVGLVEACGILMSVPIITTTWAAGINIGGIGQGLPFLICAVILHPS